MALRHKNLLILLALLIAILLIFVLIVLPQFIVPNLLRSYIEDYSQKTGYKINVEDIDFDFLTGLKGEEIAISDPIGFPDPILTVGRIALQPQIVASLISSKIKVRGIIIDKPIFSLDEAELDNLIKLMSKKEEKKKPLSIEIQHLEIRDAQIQHLPEVYVKKIELDLKDSDREEKKAIIISGLLTLLGNETKVEGEVLPYSATPSGEININLSELDTEKLSAAIKPMKLAVNSNFKFRISDSITSQGTIHFTPVKDAENKDTSLTGNLAYNLSYNKPADSAFLHSLNLDIENLIHSSFFGTVEKVKTDGALSIWGKPTEVELANLAAWIPALSDIQITGKILANEIQVSGTRADKNISLTGKALLNSVTVDNKEGDLQINDISGALDFRKAFQNQTPEALSANGSFSLKNAVTKFGELNQVSGKIDFAGGGVEKQLNISSLKANLLDGQAFGDVELKFSDSDKTLQGKLKGKSLSLNKLPEDLISTNLTGKVTALDADISSNDLINFDIITSLSARDFSLETGEEHAVKISAVQSRKPVHISFSTDSPEVQPDSQGIQDKVTVGAAELSFKKLSYDTIFADSGRLTKLLFNFGQDNTWMLSTALNGSQFKMTEEHISIGRFTGDVIVEKNEELIISGNVRAKNGRYEEIPFPTISTDFIYGGDNVTLAKLSTVVGNYGDVKANSIDIVLGDKTKNIPYRLKFSQADFISLDKKIQSHGVDGKLAFYSSKNEIRWDGDIFAHELITPFQPVNDLSVQIKSSRDTINLDKVSGKFLGGKLNGKAAITTGNSTLPISTAIELQDANFPLDKFKFGISKLNFNFKGKLLQNHFPEGNGALDFTALRIEKDGIASSLNGAVQIENANETVMLKNGFIASREGGEIKLSGEIKNTLDEKRRFVLDLPHIPAVFLKNTLSPIVPLMRDGDLTGDLSLHLRSRRFLTERAFWRGTLAINDVTFKGALSGTSFAINGVNGSITLRDAIRRPVNPFFVSLRPDEDKFEDFLVTLNKKDPEEKGDFLNVKGIEYGFLKIGDIECELVASTGGVNIKRLKSKFYGGDIYGAGLFDFSGKESQYNLSFLVDRVSLDTISISIPAAKDYITGKMNGLVWLRGVIGDLNTIDGSLKFWAIKSDEPRRIGKALLQKLGVKEKLVLRSSRKYNKGEIYGYIKDGFITFKELELSHGYFGLKDLSIEVDSRRNSISVSHFLSVMRETAKRASEGELQIEFEKKK